MGSSLMVALALIPLLLLASRCRSARLLENDLLIASANPSAFDPNINSVADSHVEKDAVQYDQENCRWVRTPASSSKNSKNEINELSSRLSPTIRNIKKADESTVSNKRRDLLNLMPPGAPSLTVVNSTPMTGQRLSKSRRSPGVGHMQMSAHKSQTRNVNMHHINGDDKSNKRNRRRGSAPSPGGGH